MKSLLSVQLSYQQYQWCFALLWESAEENLNKIDTLYTIYGVKMKLLLTFSKSITC
jgi:hypothetical protein